MVLYVAEGKWSKEIEDFAMWSFRYDMWCKMTFFGEEMRKQMAHEVVGKSRGPRNMLDMLPTEFTTVDAEAVRLKVGKQDQNYTVGSVPIVYMIYYSIKPRNIQHILHM